MGLTRSMAVTGAAAVALSLGMAASYAAPSPSAKQPQAAVDSAYALVRLSSEPLATNPRTAPAKGQKIGFDNQAVKAERDRLRAERAAFKEWLRANAPKAKVTKEFDVALNAVGVQLNGTSIDTLRSAPGVTYAELQGVFTPQAHEDPDLELIKGMEGWSVAGGAANAGKGVKVAIIDSGIDVSHPCFNDAGYPATKQLGDTKFTNNKVIVSRVYGNKVAKDGLDGKDLNGHGTHVAGTVACNPHTDTVVDGTVIPYDVSGVAPAATLGSYNVFPGTEGSGRSEDILEAMQDAYTDGFDVANMSLGGARNDGGGAFLLDNAIDNLDRANMVVAVAAGNEGPGYWTVHYPGAAPRALTAGASTVGHALVNQLTFNGQSHDMVIGEFGSLDAPLTAPIDVVEDPSVSEPHGLSLGCTAAALPDLTGKIGVVGRGTCTFQEKVDAAEAKGALGLIVVNRDDTYLTMAGDKQGIPAVMVSLTTGQALKAAGDGTTVTLLNQMVYKTFPEATNRMAGFSSWGPTHGDLLIKPDVVAPGADVLSAQPAWACKQAPCWAIFGGTSMATPHLAGTAAVVRGVHPDWSAAQVRSAIVNTAQEGLLRYPIIADDKKSDTLTNDAMIVGAGLADVQASSTATVGLDPVSISYGALSAGAGRTISRPMTLTNVTGSPQTYTVAVTDDAADDVTYSVSGGPLALAPGASGTVTVTVSATKQAAERAYQAVLRVSASGGEVAHAMLWSMVGQGVGAPGQHMTPPGQDK